MDSVMGTNEHVKCIHCSREIVPRYNIYTGIVDSWIHFETNDDHCLLWGTPPMLVQLKMVQRPYYD